MEVKNITMEKVKVPFHPHPLIPFTRFHFGACEACRPLRADYNYGGYRCNELGCDTVFHKECAMSLPEINHSSHPDHPLKLIIPKNSKSFRCSHCTGGFMSGYCCSICDFKLDLDCARMPALVHPENSYVHDHLEAYHTSHPQHPLKLLKCEGAPDYADKGCLLCGDKFDDDRRRLYNHCDVCNFSICRGCMRNPPPLGVESLTTHEHQLHLVPRRIDFTCNACGTLGDRSPYFCLQCNFMIHRDCIDLPRVININRHDHRISYTRRLGHGSWKCRVCRKKVDGFYGAYSCSKCSNYVVHSRCATRDDVWDMVELEGIPEEPEEAAPFEVIDNNTIKHFSHDHNLQINKDGMILPESTLCVACVFQICSEPFYSCKQCDFIIHEKCANLPRKKRHVCYNLPFTLHTDSPHKSFECSLCEQHFSGFRYESYNDKVLDVRCGSISEPLEHGSHLDPLYYTTDGSRSCSKCGKSAILSCDECEFSLDYKCTILPKKVMRHRYDDHPLSLSYGECNVDGKYWCEVCETTVNPKEWFYTCNDCGVILHISCVFGDLSYIMPGACWRGWWSSATRSYQVVPNTSNCRPFCHGCDSRCKLPSILQASYAARGVAVYVCSVKCVLSSWKKIIF